ncbi:uncharacterized protein K452DRAFT_290980 [Aplosporella prunicola CBS 121167]|uniref:Transcription factor domain-containing protein n=1 Tax=Aplosporella prunicola CBS 121167 TaxID=1176127 RepID=A0A6A6B3K5_9PEZI|nr:uncharacterized protein K452DRAFT_290980 [Aplosporella prunicola CBS 121167]KAF2138396.1 hypothetical protein K452DRAFT_290980 [Aplosporella prunicola CBS 121167]
MSFFMQRIQMSEICRNIADAMTDLQLEPSLMNCETLRDLNRQFEHYLAGLPFFFKLDDRSRRESQCFNQQFPHLSTQRCLIHLCAHTRRSRLHQPWLVRGFHEPQFAFARQACLESSRTVLQVARLLEDAGNKQPVDLARLSMVVHHVSLAAVVLVVDLSSTKVRGPEEEQRKLEIVEACQMLERVKRGSALAASFLASLDEILQKHKISLPAAGAASAASAAAAAAAATSPAVGSREKQPLPDFGQQQAAVGAHGDGELDAWMQGGDVDWGFDVGVDAWDELFADLNAWPVLTTESWEFAM